MPVPAYDATKTNRTLWNCCIWLGWLSLFLILELPADRHLTPWTTLSEFAWNTEAAYPPARWLFMFGLAALLTHIVGDFPR